MLERSFISFSEWLIYRAMPRVAPFVILAGLGLIVVAVAGIFWSRNM